MLREFWKRKKRSLSVGLAIWSFLVAIKIFWPEVIAESRFRLAANMAIIFGLPAIVAWDWFDFKKAKK